MHFNAYFEFSHQLQNILLYNANYFANVTNNYVDWNKYSTEFIIIM